MNTETITLSGYKKAMNCKKCPQTNSLEGCPVWLETTVTEHNTGETKVQKGCGFQMIPMLLVNIARVEDTRAAEVSQMKKEVVDSVTKASLMYLDKHARQKELPRTPDET